jgi:hypothetical protein
MQALCVLNERLPSTPVHLLLRLCTGPTKATTLLELVYSWYTDFFSDIERLSYPHYVDTCIQGWVQTFATNCDSCTELLSTRITLERYQVADAHRASCLQGVTIGIINS